MARDSMCCVGFAVFSLFSFSGQRSMGDREKNKSAKHTPLFASNQFALLERARPPHTHLFFRLPMISAPFFIDLVVNACASELYFDHVYASLGSAGHEEMRESFS